MSAGCVTIGQGVQVATGQDSCPGENAGGDIFKKNSAVLGHSVSLAVACSMLRDSC